MVFPDRFRNHILPDKLHMLNVAFLVPQMRREFGGCAGNIAYNLKLLGETGYPMGGIGSDFQPYREWMHKVGMSEKYLVTIPEEHCAQAFITTDLDDNQITAFHPGAMNHSQRIKVPAHDGITIGVIAPDSREGMLQHAEQFKAANIPFIFDPGQAMPLFAGEDFRHFIAMADWVAVNDYEWALLQERTGWTAADVSQHVKALIITRGAEGSVIHADGKRVSHPLRAGGRRGRSDRLRRRLPRRADSRHSSRARLGNHGTHRVADGRDQDRRARHAEPQFHDRRSSRSGIAPPLVSRLRAAS